MIGTVQFLQCRGSLSAGEYPLAYSTAIPGKIVNTVENVKFTEDLEQVLTLPSFDGWMDCNMVRIIRTGVASTDDGYSSAYYWITGVTRSSITQGSVDFVISYNAPTSLITKTEKAAISTVTDYMKGIWTRAPMDFAPYKQQSVLSSTLKKTSSAITLGTDLTTEYQSHGGYTDTGCAWVVITATRGATVSDKGVHLIMFPTLYNLDNPYLRPSVISEPTVIAGSAESPQTQITMSLLTLLDNPEQMMTASTIQDISIMPYCPFRHSWIGTTLEVFTGSSGSTPLLASLMETDSNGSGKYYAYVISHVYAALPFQSHTLSLSLSAMQHDTGSIQIYSEQNQPVGTIPVQYFETTGIKPYIYTLDITWSLITDYCQSWIEIQYGGESTRIPMGHIPYVGDAWSEYVAYSQSYDRQAMQYSIEQTKNQGLANIASQTANAIIGVVTGGASLAINNAAALAGATVKNYSKVYAGTQTANQLFNVSQAGSMANQATGIIGGAYAARQSMNAARFNQNLTERRIQAQPVSATALNHGLQWIVNYHMYSITIQTLLPSNLTEDIYNTYIDNFGYAVEGTIEMPLTYGFYQGTVYPSAQASKTKESDDIYMITIGCGAKADRLIEAFNQGFRFVQPDIYTDEPTDATSEGGTES